MTGSLLFLRFSAFNSGIQENHIDIIGARLSSITFMLQNILMEIITQHLILLCNFFLKS